MSKGSPNWPLILSTALGPLIWGSTYLVTTQFLPPDRPFWAALFRCLPAGILMLALARAMPLRHDWSKLLVLSALHIGIFQALLFIAAYRLPGGLAAVMGAIQPLLVLVLVFFVDRVRTTAAVWLSALLGVAGMAVLLVGPSTTFDWIGVAAALGGAACMALGTFLTQRWRLPMPVLALTGWQLLLGGLMLLPIALWFDPALPPLSGLNVAGYVYLCLFGSVIAYYLWFRGVARLPGEAVTSLSLLSPLCAVVVGWLLLGQAVGVRSGIGFALVLTSVLAVQVLAARGAKKA